MQRSDPAHQELLRDLAQEDHSDFDTWPQALQQAYLHAQAEQTTPETLALLTRIEQGEFPSWNELLNLEPAPAEPHPRSS